MSSEMIKSIAETIFNELEELKEFENEELLNPAEDLMPNEPDLNINISDTIDLTSPIFQNANNRDHFNGNGEEESDEEESSEDNEYDVNEIITNRLERMQLK